MLIADLESGALLIAPPHFILPLNADEGCKCVSASRHAHLKTISAGIPRTWGKRLPPTRTTKGPCRGSSLTRKYTPPGPFRRPMSRVQRGSYGGTSRIRKRPPLRTQAGSQGEVFSYQRGTPVSESSTRPCGRQCRPYMGTSLFKKIPSLGPYSRTIIPMVVWWS